jgi:hypothetical protein
MTGQLLAYWDFRQLRKGTIGGGGGGSGDGANARVVGTSSWGVRGSGGSVQSTCWGAGALGGGRALRGGTSGALA